MPETEIISSKKKKKEYEILNHLFFGPNFVFKGTALAKFFFVSQPLWLTFLYKGVHRIFTKLEGKHLCQSLFFKKSLLKKRLWHRCFPVNCVKFLRISFLQNTSGRFQYCLLRRN